MTQIINSSTPGKERERLSKAIVITIRSFLRKEALDCEIKDMIAFIILALQEIFDGIEQSVIAWEKRGYWVKADKYRLDWLWTGKIAGDLQLAFENKDREKTVDILLEIMAQFSNLKVSDRHRMGQPWTNAYKTYLAKIENK